MGSFAQTWAVQKYIEVIDNEEYDFQTKCSGIM